MDWLREMTLELAAPGLAQLRPSWCYETRVRAFTSVRLSLLAHELNAAIVLSLRPVCKGVLNRIIRESPEPKTVTSVCMGYCAARRVNEPQLLATAWGGQAQDGEKASRRRRNIISFVHSQTDKVNLHCGDGVEYYWAGEAVTRREQKSPRGALVLG